MNLMESGLRFLVETLIANDSVSAEYYNGVSSIPIRVIPRESSMKQNTDDFNITVEANTFDFIIPYEDLKDDPMPGDIITARGKIYEVNNYSSNTIGTVAWKWCEGCYCVARRVHTKLVGETSE